MKCIDFDLKAARQLREQGHTITKIASLMEVSRWLVMDRFKAAGISTTRHELPWRVPESETVLAYAAGLLDGEGGIYEGKGGHYRISIYNNDERILGFLIDHFAGGLNWRNRSVPVSPGASTRQGAWEVYKDEAVLIILSALYPYLTRNQDRVGLVMAQLDPGGVRRDAFWAQRGVPVIEEPIAVLTLPAEVDPDAFKYAEIMCPYVSWYEQVNDTIVDWYYWLLAAVTSPFKKDGNDD